MRIPTTTQFSSQIQLMSQQFENLGKLQAQDASGVKLQQSSDDPVLANQIKAVNDSILNMQSYAQSATLAQNRASLFDSSIEGAVGAMSQVRQLTISGQTDTLNNNDRINIAKELKSYLNSLYNIANTQDGNGNYIYSGSNTDTPAFSLQNGSYQYQGGRSATQVEIAPNVTTIYNQSGYDIFGSIPTGNGNFTVNQGSSNTGTASTTAGNIVNTSSYIPDTYTITFVTNSAGKLAYQVSGANSGQVIPAPPATAPANAPDYVSNGDMVFNGVDLTVSGAPNVGDTFIVKPSTKDNIFNTLQSMINLLEKPINSSQDKAYFNQNMTQLSASVSQASAYLIGCASDAGSRAAAIDNQVNTNNNMITQQQVVLSSLSDVDPYKVTSDITQQLTQLQITQQVYMKIQDTLVQLLKF